MIRQRRANAPKGFTLVELLVVIMIILLLSAAMIPVVVPAVNGRRIIEAANLVHAELSRARDAAVRANAPRGIRLLPDAFDPSRPLVLTSSRMVAIRPGPTYSEGEVTSIQNPSGVIPPRYGLLPYTDQTDPAKPTMVIKEYKTTSVTVGNTTVKVPNNPTSWYWNIRRGDKIQFEGSNRLYTIVGPMTVGPKNTTLPNPQHFINNGLPSVYPTGPGSNKAEFLILVDGQDNDGDGFTDELFDGIDNDGDGIIDPGFGVPGEYERDVIHENLPTNAGLHYTIFRRPVPVEDAREVTLPAGTVIDLTTWNAPSAVARNGDSAPSQPERSQLPVDPYTGYVDILVAPNGQVIQSAANANAAPPADLPYFHFWIADVEDVYNPLWGPTTSPIANTAFPMYPPIANPNYGTACPQRFLLPMPSESSSAAYRPGDTPGNPSCPPESYPPSADLPLLKADRRIVSLNTKTGQLITSRAENFSIFNTNRPFQDALAGNGEEP